jgi:hypothetical protein
MPRTREAHSCQAVAARADRGAVVRYAWPGNAPASNRRTDARTRRTDRPDMSDKPLETSDGRPGCFLR